MLTRTLAIVCSLLIIGPCHASTSPLRAMLESYLPLGQEYLAAQEVRRLLAEQPAHTTEILDLLLEFPMVRAYLRDKRQLPLVIDNSLPQQISVHKDNDTFIHVRAFGHAVIACSPADVTVRVHCPHLNWRKSYELKLISPRDKRDHIVLNVGKRNSYFISGYDVDSARRHVGHSTNGWPTRLTRPEMFWFRGDEIFPIQRRRNWSPPRSLNPIISLERQRPEWFELKYWHTQGKLKPGLF